MSDEKRIRDPSRTKRIPEPFQEVSSVTLNGPEAKAEVPMLVLYGQWLKAAGFPIGSAVVLSTDEHGYLVLHRLGLELPRRLHIHAVPS
ncbi:MAG TPA: hypothetical protein VFV97_02480 [Rhodanobacteraceae bacterium]|nr:hypothetical protein [Rhodanobacteraceae bacterium]